MPPSLPALPSGGPGEKARSRPGVSTRTEPGVGPPLGGWSDHRRTMPRSCPASTPGSSGCALCGAVLVDGVVIGATADFDNPHADRGVFLDVAAQPVRAVRR